MANEEKMNVDIENQENFAKKKKITIICLSAGLVFITLIAGLLLVKKNKESRYENNDLEEVVNDSEDNEDIENDNENDGIIINEGDYFFNKTSYQVTTNILLSLITGILFFFWENDKLSDYNDKGKLCDYSKEDLLCGGEFNIWRGRDEKEDDQDVGVGIFERANLFGFASLGFLIFITFLVELVLCLLLGSLAHLFSKDKNKRYFHTLTMSWKKRKQIFSSFSKTKTFFVVFSYLLGAFVIAIVARLITKKLKPCCCRGTGVIVYEHNIHYCLGYYKVEYEYPQSIV